MNYELNINYEGNDYTVQVSDLETANFILNDPVGAFQYLSKYYPHFLPGSSSANNEPCPRPVESFPPVPMLETESDATPKATDATSEHSHITSVDSNFDATLLDSGTVWVAKRPTATDLEATTLLLSLRQSMEGQFKDKKSIKSKLWQKIASILESKNFKVGKNGAERCRQKFANLTKAYLLYIKHQSTTGEGNKMDPPPFFNELHSLLSSKHKVNPTFLSDTINDEGTENNINIAESRENKNEDSNVQNTSPSGEVNRFNKSRKKIRPESKTEYVLRELKQANESRNEQFNFFKDYLVRTQQQTDRFLDLFEQGLSKKRKHENISESDSE